MSDELDLLRAANPVRSGEGPWRDRPLSAHAERGLNRLLHSKRTKRARRRLVLRAEAAVLVLGAVLAFTFSDIGAGAAVAVPVALAPQAGAPSVSLDRLARRAEARARAAGAADGPHRGSHLQSWYASVGAGPGAAPSAVVPEERVTRWRADGSGFELVVATDPRHPGRRVIDDTGGRWRTVKDGKVLHRKTYPAGPADGHRGLGARTRPPTDPEALREQLATLYGATGRTTPQLLAALSALLQQWTPGPRETAAIVRVLADAEGMRPAGGVTDRLGRRGQAYVYDGPDGAMNATRQMVVLDARTGQFLGTEITFTKDLPDFKIKSGEVLSYEAWMP
ncbi:CU044_5270 family protein [Streptomyces sp. NPDC048483]|uniref:CU044_5270 family protein n=1 Tax=Streptomyces sp. NPDC048483 TaxID=3154927 RepID=UPI0034412266